MNTVAGQENKNSFEERRRFMRLNINVDINYSILSESSKDSEISD